jgi:hypothetical protein
MELGEAEEAWVDVHFGAFALAKHLYHSDTLD